MKRTIYGYLFFILCSFTAYSQSSDSLKHAKVKLFISGGVNVATYFTDDFAKQLFAKTYYGNPAELFWYQYSLTGGSVVPENLGYSQLSMGPIASLGIEFHSNNNHKVRLNHTVEASYTNFLCSYSGADYYKEEDRQYGGVYVNDTINMHYAQSIIALGYKFQPVYKSVFLSFGVNCLLDLVKNHVQIKENRETFSRNEFGVYSYSFSTTNPDYITHEHFINFPIQLGAGYYFKTKRIIFKPAFYFTPYFTKGYNFYNLSLAILYNH